MSADLLAIAFDRGPLAILRVELPQICGGGSSGGKGLDIGGLVTQRITAARSHMLAQPPAYGDVKAEINAALLLLRCVKVCAQMKPKQRVVVANSPVTPTLADLCI